MTALAVCGTPAPIGLDACCQKDAEAKAVGAQGANGDLGKPEFRWSGHGSDQRQKDQADSERRYVPYKRAQQKNPRCVQGEMGDARPRIEVNTPLGHPTVCGRNMRCQDGCCGQ
jgi:hypothetical protein